LCNCLFEGHVSGRARQSNGSFAELVVRSLLAYTLQYSY
jgi:hypothetical protein